MSQKYCKVESKQWVAFTGEDARLFLNGQLSSDVKNLEPLSWQYSTYSTPKGRMLGSFIVYAESSTRFLLLMDRGLVEGLVKRLKMFVLRSKVVIEPLDIQTVGIIGAESPVFNSLFSLTISQNRRLVGLSSLDGILPLEPEVAWALADIEAGVAWVVPETVEAFVPQTANMELIGAVSFKKGCYPGQEIVARAQYLGQVKRRLMGFEVQTEIPLKAGDPLFLAGLADTEISEAVGKVANVVEIKQGTFRFLAVVLKEAEKKGLCIQNGEALKRFSLAYSLPEETASPVV